jgi:polyisoprenoid-binding protein YceI
MRFRIFCLLAGVISPSLSRAQAPVFEIIPAESWIKFREKASTTIAGKFDNWDASLTFTSTNETTGVLEIKIQAASVDTGSGMKDDKLRSKDVFDVKQDPLITFHSTKIVQTGPNTFDVSGKFTIRGVTKDKTLHLVVSGKGRSAARTTA